MSSAEVARPRAGTPKLDFFVPHPHLGDEINRNICQSEIEGGVLLDDLPVGAMLEVQTRHHTYTVENRGDRHVLIAGHPEYCPDPVLVAFHGSTWGKSMIKLYFIGRGMRMEFRHPMHGIVRTSKVEEIREVPPQSGGLRRMAG